MIVRCLFAGLRHRGRLLLDVFATDRRFDAVGFVDHRVETCRRAAAESGRPELPCFDDLDEAWRAVDADALVLLRDPGGRARDVRQALKMGRHVYVSNPLAESLESARDLVDLAELEGRALVVDAPQRYGVTERTLEGWRREGRYGPLRAVTLRVSRPAEPATLSAWERCAPDLSALLPLVGWGATHVDSARGGPTGVEAHLRLQEGVTCRYESHTGEPSTELRFDFVRASVRAVGSDPRDKHLEWSVPPAPFERADIRDTDDPDPRERFSKESFYRAVTQGVRVAGDGLEHLAALAVVDAVQRSAKSGAPAAVEPVSRPGRG